MRAQPAPGTAFAAHGGTLAVHDSTGTIQASTAVLSSLGYSGEFFDAAAQQQYLRARFYNPANGRFNRLDPFAGNLQDPQSLHKYAYVHGDPIQGVDPNGLSAESASPQPFSFKIGNAAHSAIQEDYRKWAANNFKFVQTEPYNNSFQNLIRPDLLNLSDFLVGEIKPYSPAEISKGYAKLIASRTLLNGMSTTYEGKSIDPAGPLPGQGGKYSVWGYETWSPGLRAYILVDYNADIRDNIAVTLGNWRGLVVYKNFRRRKIDGTVAEFATRAVKEAERVVRIADVNGDGQLTGNEIEVGYGQWEISDNLINRYIAIGVVVLGLALAHSLASAVSLKGFTSRLGSAGV